MEDDLANFEEGDISEKSDESSSKVSSPVRATKEFHSCSKSPAIRICEQDYLGENIEEDEVVDKAETFTFAVSNIQFVKAEFGEASPIPKFKSHVISKNKWNGNAH